MAGSRLLSTLGLAVVGAAVIVGAAGAVIVPNIPNTSFESVPPCSPFPDTTICGWNDLVGTITHDGTQHHTGSFSMRIDGTSGSVEATTTGGICISPISPGSHGAAFWYLTSAPVVDVQFGAEWYPNANCSVATFGSSALHAPTPVTYGSWTQVIGTLTAPPGTGSAFFSVFASCQCGVGAVSANFDDVGFESSPSAVTVVSFAAARSGRRVLVRWRTAAEAGMLGFHVYRERAGKRVRLDPHLIPAKGSVSGARYSFIDSRAPRGKVTYRLQGVGTDGARAWYGRVSVPR
jgi:hypothetical protein